METIESAAKYSADPPRYLVGGGGRNGSISPPVDRMINPSMIKQQQKQLLLNSQANLNGNTFLNSSSTHKYLQHLQQQHQLQQQQPLANISNVTSSNMSGDSGVDIIGIV